MGNYKTGVMLRLKNRQQSPPGGFLYEQAGTLWQSWKVDPISQWDFPRLCRSLQQHRLANRQYNFATDMPTIEMEVDMANALRVARLPNTESYVTNDQSPNPKLPAPKTLDLLQSVAGAVKKVDRGIDTIDEFIASGESPVDEDLSNHRAAVCAGCPLNGQGDFTRWFTIPASELIRKKIEAREERGLETIYDQHLGVCEACLCPLKLKVHFPLKFIKAHMDGETLQALDAKCWIREEMK